MRHFIQRYSDCIRRVTHTPNTNISRLQHSRSCEARDTLTITHRHKHTHAQIKHFCILTKCIHLVVWTHTHNWNTHEKRYKNGWNLSPLGCFYLYDISLTLMGLITNFIVHVELIKISSSLIEQFECKWVRLDR